MATILPSAPCRPRPPGGIATMWPSAPWRPRPPSGTVTVRPSAPVSFLGMAFSAWFGARPARGDSNPYLPTCEVGFLPLEDGRRPCQTHMGTDHSGGRRVTKRFAISTDPMTAEQVKQIKDVL